jgi:hypothetical protein
MMEGDGSPKRSKQPLLPDDESMQVPRMGAYRPPPTSSSIVSEPYDLHLTAAVGGGGGGSLPDDDVNRTGDFQSSVSYSTPTVIHHNGLEEEMEYQLPPLISYCSYVKYACAFLKWLIPVAIINTVAYWMCVKGRYFDYYGYWGMGDVWPFDSWKGGMLALVWFGTSIFFYLSAKGIDRDVQYVDTTAQYQLGNTNDSSNTSDGVYNSTGTGSHGGGGAPPAPALNFEHVYGQVSRKLDHFFRPKSASSTSRMGSPPPIEGTSSLVNFSFALWVLALGAAVFLGTGFAIGMIYVDDICSPTSISNNSTSASGSKFGLKDYSYIGNYPQTVQDWILAFNNGYYYGSMMDDSNIDDSPRVSEYPFPVSYSSVSNVVASMVGGDTIFFAAKPPSTKITDSPNDGGVSIAESKSTVLVESNSEGKKYFNDIVNPRMFIPIENTISEDADGNLVASQYCFISAMDAAQRKKNKNRSWESLVRTTTIRCIVKKKDPSIAGSNGDEFDIIKATVAWKDKSYYTIDGVRAASSGGILLVARLGQSDQYMYEEAVSVDPADDMKVTSIFHLTKTNEEYWNNWEDGSGGSRSGSRCVQQKVQPYATIASMVVMVLGGLWLILREGVAAGVVPFMFCGVAIVRIMAGEYSNGINNLCMVVGTMFFHFVLCCGSDGVMGHICHLPNWIGRDMYIWSLYSWILSFYVMNFLFRMNEIVFGSLILLVVSGIILDHPIGHVMGYWSVMTGLFYLAMWPFFGRYGGFGYSAALAIVIGFGMIGVSNFFSDNRRFCGALCRPCSRAGRAMVYGSPTAVTAGGAATNIGSRSSVAASVSNPNV